MPRERSWGGRPGGNEAARHATPYTLSEDVPFGGETALWPDPHNVVGVHPGSRTGRSALLDEGVDLGFVNGIPVAPAGGQRPLFLCGFDYAQVVDAKVFAGFSASFQEAGVAMAARSPMMLATMATSMIVKPLRRPMTGLR